MNYFDKRVLDTVKDCKDYYFEGEYTELKELDIRGYIFSRLYTTPSKYFTAYAMKDKTLKLKDVGFEYTKKEVKEFHCRFEFDSSIKYDGFRLTIRKDMIQIKASSDRGFLYAYRYVDALLVESSGRYYLPVIEVIHEPSVRVRGILEGFYGTPWTHEERLDEVDFLCQAKLNAFMYAPKDDIYHREKWAVLYPEKEMSQVKEIISKCQEQYIDFYYAISPGNDIKYKDADDLRKLMDKLEQVIEVGVTRFALLLDDIDYDLEASTRIAFSRSGIAQAYLANQVYECLGERMAEYEFIVCPTEYMQSFETQYKEDLERFMNPDIAIMWTGSSIIPRRIHNTDMSFITTQYKRKIAIWDNVPCNDYEKKKVLSFTPYMNRTKQIESFAVDCVFANAMLQYEPSKLTVFTMADYLWNAGNYNPIEAFHKSVTTLEPVKNEALEFFCAHHQNCGVYETIPPQIKEAIEHNEVNTITKEMEQLYHAARELEEMQNLKLKRVIQPWIERTKKDYEAWDKILSGSMKQEDFDEIKEDSISSSSCIPFRYYQKHMLQDEDWKLNKLN
jgi:hyaluronoglucosaminidase